MQSLDQVRMRLVSQLIRIISKIMKKLLWSILMVLLFLYSLYYHHQGDFQLVFTLHLSRLHNIVIDFLTFSKNYHYVKLYIGITTSMSFALCAWVLFTSLKQSLNVAKFSDVTSLYLSSACLLCYLVCSSSCYCYCPRTTIQSSL